MEYDFASYLEKASLRGDEVSGCSPFRSDANPSFSGNIRSGLWIDHGTGEKGNYEQFCARLGIAQKTASNHVSRSKHKEYIYFDCAGNRRLKVSRKEQSSGLKTFYQSHWTGSSWQKGKGKGSIAPYRFHENWKDSKELLFLVEGEKCVERLEKEQLLATSIPGGSKAWRNEYAKFFEGKKVVILPDNDTPGKDFAEKAQQSISQYVHNSVILQLPNLKDKEDIVEWLDKRGGSKSALLQLAKRELSKNTVSAVSINEIAAEEVSWLWPEHIPNKAITIFTGDPGVGKSYLCCYLASALSRGAKLPTKHNTNPINVMLFCVEDDLAQTVRPRLEQMNANLERIHAFPDPMSFSEAKDRANFERMVRETNSKVVIIDPIMAYMGGKVDTHRANEVRNIIQHIGKLAKELGIAIIFVRHSVKASSGTFGKIKGIHYGQGSIDFTALSRSEFLVINSPIKNSSEKLFVHIKSNYGPKQKALAYSISDGELEWLGEREIQDSELGAATSEEDNSVSAYSEAKEHGLMILKEGPMKSEDFYKSLQELGVAKRTWARVRRSLDGEVKHYRDRDENGDLKWYITHAPRHYSKGEEK